VQSRGKNYVKSSENAKVCEIIFPIKAKRLCNVFYILTKSDEYCAKSIRPKKNRSNKYITKNKIEYFVLCEFQFEILRTRRCHFVIYSDDERSLCWIPKKEPLNVQL